MQVREVIRLVITLTPTNDGREPSASVMVNESSGVESKTPRGSLRSLSSLLPLLPIWMVITPGTLTLTSRPTVSCSPTVAAGAAQTATADATRATREARREEENIAVKGVKVVEEATPMKPQD